MNTLLDLVAVPLSAVAITGCHATGSWSVVVRDGSGSSPCVPVRALAVESGRLTAAGEGRILRLPGTSQQFPSPCSRGELGPIVCLHSCASFEMVAGQRHGWPCRPTGN